MTDGYYTCDCDKYNPECRCHPKERPMTTDLREAVARAIYGVANIAPESFDETSQHRRDRFTREADAAIAAIGPTVPVIPEGITRFTIRTVGGEWMCWATRDITPMEAVSRVGKAGNPFAALTAAIQAAKGREE